MIKRRQFLKLASGLCVTSIPRLSLGSASIISQTIGGVAEQSVIILNDSFSRLINFGTAWNVIRIGCRIQFGGAAQLTSFPHFGIGLSAGDVKLVGNPTTSGHFLGMITNEQNWSYSSGGGTEYFIVYGYPAVKVGLNTTYTSLTLTDQGLNNWTPNAGGDVSGDNRTVLALEIAKGSPNYTLRSFYNQASTAGSVTSATFQTQMAAAKDGMVITNHGYGTARTIAVNEATNGTFNAMSFLWDSKVANCYLYDVALNVLS